MDLKDVKQLIRLVDEKKFAEFELQEGEFRLRIKRNEAPIVQYTGHPPSPMQNVVQASATETTLAESGSTGGAAAGPALEVEADFHLITSPIVGTFFRASGPSAEPFVREGHRVQPGTVLCIVEAMKIMNEITSDVAGVVVKIHAENGRPVEFGQPLFSVKVE